MSLFNNRESLVGDIDSFRNIGVGQRGAGEVVCTAPTQLKVYEYGKSLCKNKTTQ